jgi:hypothetical protein
MQSRNTKTRHWLIATLPLAVLLAACGTTAATTTHSSSPTPTPAATTILVPTPSPTSVPTSAPGQPLAVLYGGPDSPQGGLEVVNGQGVKQWGLTYAQEGAFFGLTPQQAGNFTPGDFEIGGSNLFFFSQATPTSPNKIAVVSRTGQLLGIGTAPALPNSSSASYYWSFVVSPTGTEWAWPLDQTPLATGQHHGIVEVGGLGEANRILYRWVAPLGFTETLVGWTDTGIVMQRTGDGPCGYGPDAWFTVNPDTGKLAELVTDNEQFLAASSGVTVAGLLNDPHTVLINGVRYSESKSVFAGAAVSPDGGRVAVMRASFNPCGSGNIPEDSIEIVNVANHTHVDLQGIQLVSWWDNNEIIAVSDTESYNPPPTIPVPTGDTTPPIRIYSLQGQKVSEIIPANFPWSYQGVLS